MSYLVLARKSRPQTFDEVVGQRSVVKTLQNSLKRDRVAHAILFSGVRGVGKTTLARIMAKAINCEGDSESRPCNVCRPCREITGGGALDLLEIDGASNRGIQEIRELKEKIKFLPTSCKFKIIIIDEVHMLTTEAFNALLKTLEEPPAHVHFMFATTELHKIPITILSRCQQYELKRISAAELTDHFARLAREEGVEIEPKALSLIVREAEGSVRDGLSLLDQVFSFGEKKIGVADVTEVLGLVNRDILWQLTEALLAGERATALTSLEDIFLYGMDIRRFSADLLECFRTLLLSRIEGCAALLDMPAEELARCQELAARFSPESIHQKLTMLMLLVEGIRHSSQPRLALETGFLRIIEAGNVVGVSEILGKIEHLMSGKSIAPQQPATVAARTAVVQPSPPSQPPPAAETETKKKIAAPDQVPPATPEPPDDGDIPPPDDEAAMASAPAEFGDDHPVTEEPPSGEALPPPPQRSAVCVQPHAKDIRKHWQQFVAYVKERIVWMAQDLNRARVKETDGILQLHYDDPAECSLLRTRENKNQLTEFVLDFFQKELKVQFVLPKIEENGDDKNGGESPHQKRQQLANDPLTIMTAEIFHGQIGDIRIGPRSR